MNNQELITFKEASEHLSLKFKRDITTSNISYLVNYGRVNKFSKNGNTLVNKQELLAYYNSYYGERELNWKEKLGNDIDWHLSFENYKEAQTTKHVHRLHPYKGKFIPQLVEYFLDSHTDEFKRQVYFNEGDIVLDPFCGSGTTLVQANELGIHAVGVDISRFNSLISNVKIGKYDLQEIDYEIKLITESLHTYVGKSKIAEFDNALMEELSSFNDKYFPSPSYKMQVRNKTINEILYGKEKEEEFLQIFNRVINKYDVKLFNGKNDNFLDKWYFVNVRNEIDFVFSLIKKVKNSDSKKVLSIILSRTIRSCRATTHSDLATLLEPISSTYYCSKHGKICKPLFTILSWWERYSKDTLRRLSEFNRYRTNTFQHCYTADSRNVDLLSKVEENLPNLAKILKKQKIKGIFTSPPYVGLIDYHEQHAYAYDLFGLEKKSELEIGTMNKGKGIQAQNLYVDGIVETLHNCRKYLANDYNIFIVANDKYNLYPIIAEKLGMKIVQQFKRPVLNRTEKDKGAYSESIFLFKNK